jgi:hypothetical protein
MTTRKVKIPDGKGGWTELEGEILPGSTADKKKQEAALEQQFILEAAKITDRMLKFDRQLIIEDGLTKEHRAFAGALYYVNLRETYPGSDGKTPDPAAFDAITKKAVDYYDASVAEEEKK